MTITITETKYICVDCGKGTSLGNLLRKKTITINQLEIRYQYSCRNCHCRKFKIRVIVKKSE